jgi:hypothetical protein
MAMFKPCTSRVEQDFSRLDSILGSRRLGGLDASEDDVAKVWPFRKGGRSRKHEYEAASNISHKKHQKSGPGRVMFLQICVVRRRFSSRVPEKVVLDTPTDHRKRSNVIAAARRVWRKCYGVSRVTISERPRLDKGCPKKRPSRSDQPMISKLFPYPCTFLWYCISKTSFSCAKVTEDKYETMAEQRGFGRVGGGQLARTWLEAQARGANFCTRAQVC